MALDRKVASYIELAREDLAAAKALIASGLERNSTIHIQQAAEKLLKAVLAAEDIVFPASHQIGALAELLRDGHFWKDEFRGFDPLTRYATAYRYPTPGGDVPTPPTRKELQQSIESVVALVDEVRDWCAEKPPRP